MQIFFVERETMEPAALKAGQGVRFLCLASSVLAYQEDECSAASVVSTECLSPRQSSFHEHCWEVTLDQSGQPGGKSF